MPKEDKYKTHYSPAVQAKVDYIRSTIKSLDAITICVNCSLTVDNNVLRPLDIKDEYGSCRVLFSLSCKKRILLPLCGATMLISVLFFLLFNVKKGDVIILYHSIYYDFIVRMLKAVKKYRIIYEIEEIYADVRDKGKGREKEILKCEKAADAFIFPTELLNEAVNVNQKPNIIIYGAYTPVKKEKVDRRNDKTKTIIVYSGILMEGKGARQAVECANSLDKEYEIRIIGYGNTEEINNIKRMIQCNRSECNVVFDGMKYGDEYINYLSECDIGLCLQPNENYFNATSFPSKVMSYLNTGLKVVATEMESLKRSKLASFLSFSYDSSSEQVAKAIERAKSMKPPSYHLIVKMDNEVRKNICRIIT